MKNKITTLLFFSTLSVSALAADFKFQNIRAGGAGCPEELTQIVMAPDSSSASIIFAQFESRVPNTTPGPKTQRNINNLNCNIFVDVLVPSGIKLDSIELSYDMRGFTTLDRGVLGSFTSYLMSSSGLGTEARGNTSEVLAEKIWRNININQEEDFIVSAVKRLSLPSQCSRGSNTDVVSIRLQNTLSSQIQRGFENQSEGSITMDSSDLKGGLRLRAQTSSCNSSIGQNNPGRADEGRNCRIVRIGRISKKVCI